MKAAIGSETNIEPQKMLLTTDSLWSAYCRPNEIQIECQDGTVWITQEGDHRDIILQAGEQYRIEKQGLVIVQAIGRATILVYGIQRQ
jgi:hypothetical protein